MWDRDERSERAQTSIDLLLAIGLFFTAIALILMQSPWLYATPNVSASDNYTPADSIANTLTSDELGNAHGPGLNETKVIDFFSQSDSTVADEFSIPDHFGVNVTLTHVGDGPPPERLQTIADGIDSGNHYVTRGPSPGSLDSTVTEYTTMDEEMVTIEVTVWRK